MILEKIKKTILKWEKENHLFLYLSVFLLTVGVYFTFPERGYLATFPLLFFLSVPASFLLKPLFLAPLIAGAIGFLYGLLASFPAKGEFFLVSFLMAFCGAGIAFLIRKAKKGKKALLLLILPLVALGMISPSFLSGTPAAYKEEKEKALSYLALQYPDQTFDPVVFFYDASAKAYCATVYYPNGEYTLSSQIVFSSQVKDGFRENYADFVLTKEKSKLIDVFGEKGFSVVTENKGFTLDEEEPLPGTYGTVSEEMKTVTHFEVTFRDEKPKREEFAEACREVLSALQEKECSFGRITFYGLDAGNRLYTCQVEYDTDPETVLSLVKYVR